MIYLITPVTIDIEPDGGKRYYSNGGDITNGYVEKQDRIRKMLGTSYCTLMDTLKQQIKGFRQDYCNHQDAGDTIGKWTCREIIEQEGDYGKKYLVLFTHPFELKK